MTTDDAPPLVFHETAEHVSTAREMLRREWQHGVAFTEHRPWWCLGLITTFAVTGPASAMERVARKVEHLKRYANLDGIED